MQGAEFGVQGSGCRVQGSGFRVQGAGCRVQGAGCTSPARSLEPSVPWMVPSESGEPTATGAPPAGREEIVY